MVNFSFIKKYVPRWAILVIDLIISLISLLIAYFLRFNFSIPSQELKKAVIVISVYLTVRIISFLMTKIYAGVIRYTSTRDALRVLGTILMGTLFLVLINFLSYSRTEKYLIPFSILIIDFALLTTMLVAMRLIVKALYFESLNGKRFYKSIIIYGGDEYGMAVKRSLERDPSDNFKIIAFLDNFSKGKIIDGIEVYPVSMLENLIDSYNVSHLILAKKDRFQKVEKYIIDTCIDKNIKVLRIPSAEEWINGELSFKQIKKIKIEDLLERDPIKLNLARIEKNFKNKTIIVTGSAGSIGSELVRQLSKYKPKILILIDQAESALYDLELELREKIRFDRIEPIIADITDPIRIEKIFQTFKPEIVFHAAAYKHVPMMENNPYEAVKTNIGGTKNLADLSVKYQVRKFIMISTDKAVNPTNVMGASKRIAEIYTQALNKLGKTQFITTRFGNVLGSNGSVIPRFRKQIEEGGPITVTHPEITRFFMTIPEACQLVLEAGSYGNGGEIFIFDMGESVKIIDLAKKMIKLSGLELGKDIQIKITGLRPGEKLYEELLHDKENTIPTYHPKIMIAKVKEYELTYVQTHINELIKILKNHNNMEMVAKMKEIVPEFISKNSVYEALDKKTTKN